MSCICAIYHTLLIALSFLVLALFQQLYNVIVQVGANNARFTVEGLAL